jgi:hypothetical protein
MTIPPLTASELFDLVKEHGEMYEHVLFYQPPTPNRTPGLGCWRGAGSNWFIRDEIAALTLLALFALAAECGVGYNDVTRRWYAVDVNGEVEDTGTDVHPLRAAVAGYKKKGAERG